MKTRIEFHPAEVKPFDEFYSLEVTCRISKHTLPAKFKKLFKKVTKGSWIYSGCWFAYIEKGFAAKFYVP